MKKIVMLRGTLLLLSGLLINISHASLLGLFQSCSPASGIIVNTFSHELFVCERGKIIDSFPVALGHSGIGKKSHGDGKTPLGTYGLGYPHPSRDYGMFIPVLYPNPMQRHQGYSGSGVGIHGPPRYLKNAGDYSTSVNWTDGCIALPSDQAVAEVARWLKQHPHLSITIES